MKKTIQVMRWFIYLILFIIFSCGNKIDIPLLQIWVEESIRDEMKLKDEYKDIVVMKVDLIKESKNKYVGFVTYGLHAE